MKISYENSTEGPPPGPRPPYFSPKRIVLGLCAFFTLGLAALIIVPKLLLEDWLSGLSNVDPATARLAIGNAAQVVLFGLGGTIALIGVGLSLSRHSLELRNAEDERAKEVRRIGELDQQRRADTERELRSRFAQAVALISNQDMGTTRQAGVYALGALADDWSNHGRPDERQVCIDVLCGYLRSRWDPAAEDADDERRVRVSGFGLIGEHLRLAAEPHSWHGSLFNLMGSIIDFDIDFSGILLEAGTIDLGGAYLAGGRIRFDAAQLTGGKLNLDSAKFAGSYVNFTKSALSGTTVSARFAEFTEGMFTLHTPRFSGSRMLFTGSKFSGTTFRIFEPALATGAIDFSGAIFSGGRVRFVALDRPPERSVSFANADFSGADIKFERGLFTEYSLELADAQLSSGRLRFDRAEFEPDYEEWLTKDLLFSGGALVVDGKVYWGRPGDE